MSEDPRDTEIVLHDVQLGQLRLYLIMKDVRVPDNPTSALPPVLKVPFAYQSAHASWLEEANWAVDQAMIWWSSITEGFREPGMSWEAAARLAYEQWPSGPASSEYVVSVVRRHWLECERINARLSSGEVIWPEDFLLRTLDEQRYSRIILALTAMPYWPIGLDENGNWC